MKQTLVILIFLGSSSSAIAQEPDLFQAGIYGDLDRTVTCISGQSNDAFTQYIWAWVPDDLGLAYITLRIDFPENLDHSVRPEFNPLVSDVILTDYPDGTQEWNMLFTECPSGWVQVCSQSCILLDDQLDEIQVLANHSMMRDCNFVLNDLTVLNNFTLNDPDCDFVPTRSTSWGMAKTLYR